MKCVNTGPQLNKLIDGSRNNVTVPNSSPPPEVNSFCSLPSEQFPRIQGQ